jgi:hypothetical protein
MRMHDEYITQAENLHMQVAIDGIGYLIILGRNLDHILKHAEIVMHQF